MKLIFAQGNPEQNYAKTRHNTGFEIINEFAKTKSLNWTEKPKFSAIISDLTFNDEKIILAKPTTFYNETGLAIRQIIDFYKIEPKDILVVHDELALEIGQIRIRDKGSAAGNNGIKSIISHIGENFNRLRIGIKSTDESRLSDADFVLSRFNSEENQLFEQKILPSSIKIIEDFCNNNLKITSINAKD